MCARKRTLEGSTRETEHCLTIIYGNFTGDTAPQQPPVLIFKNVRAQHPDTSPLVHNIRMIGRFHQRDGRLWKMHARFTGIAVNKAWVMFTAGNFYCPVELQEIACIPSDWCRTSLNIPVLKFSAMSKAFQMNDTNDGRTKEEYIDVSGEKCVITVF